MKIEVLALLISILSFIWSFYTWKVTKLLREKQEKDLDLSINEKLAAQKEKEHIENSAIIDVCVINRERLQMVIINKGSMAAFNIQATFKNDADHIQFAPSDFFPIDKLAGHSEVAVIFTVGRRRGSWPINVDLKWEDNMGQFYNDSFLLNEPVL